MRNKLIAIIFTLMMILPGVMADTHPLQPSWDADFNIIVVPMGADGALTDVRLYEKCTAGDLYLISVQESNPNYDLSVQKIGGNQQLVISNLDPDYAGEDTITLTCTSYTAGASPAVKHITFKVQAPLETELTGFPYVVKNSIQRFTAKVTERGNPVEGAIVNVYDSNDRNKGHCDTSSNGQCTIDVTMGDPAQDVTYYAWSDKDGYYADHDKDSTFTFDVVDQIFEIEDFTTYSDAFTTQSNTFKRGEPLYVSFKVRDIRVAGEPYLNVHDSSILKQVFLSQDSDAVRYNLESYTGTHSIENPQDNTYYYVLNALPTNDEVLGGNAVFGFVFEEAQPGAGGAEHVQRITVYNNVPVITGDISEAIQFDENGYAEVNLNDYASDVEDAPEDMTWKFWIPRGISGFHTGEYATTYEDDFVTARIVDNVLKIFGDALGTFTNMVLRLVDTEGDYASQTVHGDVTHVFVGVLIDADQTTGNAPLTVHFTSEVRGVPDDYTYAWDFDNDGTVDSTAANPTYTYTNAGLYTAKLVVSQEHGRTYTDSMTIRVKDAATIVKHTDDGEETLNPRDTVYIGRINIPGQGVITSETPQLMFTVNLENRGNSKLRDLRVRASIPELGLTGKSIGPFDLKPGEDMHETIRILNDGSLTPGSYLVRLTVSNDDIYRAVHREVIVE